MFDIKTIHTVLEQLEEERGIPQAKVIEAIEAALATAYKKEYGKRGQVIAAKINMETGETEFEQVKTVVTQDMVYYEDEDAPEYPEGTPEEDQLVRFSEEQHMFLADATMIKKDTKVGDEMIFPLEVKEDYGRISAQTAKQVIIQKIREAEKVSVLAEYGEMEGQIISGTVERVERGSVFLNLGRAIGMLPHNEQIRGENFKQGERVRAYLMRVEETPRGVFLRLSRSHPKFLEALFAQEVPEIQSGVVEVKDVVREAGARSKIAVYSSDENIDPIGALVGQGASRVRTIMAELGNERIDIVEWSPTIEHFIEDALSPAKVVEVEINEETQEARVAVTGEQLSLAIGKGGENARLAAKITGWKIDIYEVDMDGQEVPKQTREERAADMGAAEILTAVEDESTEEVSDEEGTPVTSADDIVDEETIETTEETTESVKEKVEEAPVEEVASEKDESPTEDAVEGVEEVAEAVEDPAEDTKEEPTPETADEK